VIARALDRFESDCQRRAPVFDDVGPITPRHEWPVMIPVSGVFLDEIQLGVVNPIAPGWAQAYSESDRDAVWFAPPPLHLVFRAANWWRGRGLRYFAYRLGFLVVPSGARFSDGKWSWRFWVQLLERRRWRAEFASRETGTLAQDVGDALGDFDEQRRRGGRAWQEGFDAAMAMQAPLIERQAIALRESEMLRQNDREEAFDAGVVACQELMLMQVQGMPEDEIHKLGRELRRKASKSRIILPRDN